MLTTERLSKEAFSELTGASVHVRWWNEEKGLEADERLTASSALNADAAVLRARKRVIDTDHPAWKAVVSVRSDFRRWWESASIPFVYPGVRLIRRSAKPEVWAAVEGYSRDLSDAVRLLDDARDELVGRARRTLGAMFRPEYYPHTWRGLFSLEVRERSIEPPSYLAHANSEEYKRELERSLGDIRSSLLRFEQAAWKELSDLAFKFTAKLTDGGPWAQANLDAMQRLFDRVAVWNFEGTAAFKDAVERTREVVSGLTAADLRAREGLRDQVRSEMVELLGLFREVSGAMRADAPEAAVPA
jgi:hypothetical protein